MRARTIPILLGFGLCLSLTSAGCQPTEEQIISDAEKPVSSLTDPNKKAAYLRIVNVSGSPVNPVDKQRPLTGEIANLESSRMVAASSKMTELSLGEKIPSVPTQLKSGSGTTVVALPNGKVGIISDEKRNADGGNNVRVVFMDENGQTLTAGPEIKATGPTSDPVLSPGAELTLATGDYTVKGGPVKGSASVKVEAKFAYTFLFIKEGSKFVPFLLLNGDNQRPAGAGMSGT